MQISTNTHTLLSSREPKKLLLRYVQIIGLSLFIGMVYHNTNQSQSGIFGRIGYLFFSLCIIALITITSTVYEFVSNKQLILYEYTILNYSCSAYYISKWLYELFIQFTLVLLFLCISYYMIQLQDTVQSFVYQLIALTVLSWTCHSTALVLGAVINDTFVASVAAPLTIVPFMYVYDWGIHNWFHSSPIYIIYIVWLVQVVLWFFYQYYYHSSIYQLVSISVPPSVHIQSNHVQSVS